jgi:hypothetical protein
MSEYHCPACGDLIDYCQGHGEIGDPDGAGILDLHDQDMHGRCHPRSECKTVESEPCGRGTPGCSVSHAFDGETNCETW